MEIENGARAALLQRPLIWTEITPRPWVKLIRASFARLHFFFFSIAAHLYTHGTLSLADLVGAFVHAIYVGAHAHRATPLTHYTDPLFSVHGLEACT